jgi:hypothetical protein
MSARAWLAVSSLLFAVPVNGADGAWCRENNKTNRCEGALTQQVAASSVVEMIGFHAYRQDFRSANDVTLRVRFYAPDAAPKARVTARDFDRKSFYWMETAPRAWQKGWNRFAPWPVRDVLRSMKLNSDSLLVFVRLDGLSFGSGMVAPAFITTSDAPAGVREYHVYLLPGKDLKSVTYELRSVRSGKVESHGSLDRQATQTPFLIRIPAANLEAGLMRLDLKCGVARQPGPAAHFSWTFEHRPQSPGGV